MKKITACKRGAFIGIFLLLLTAFFPICVSAVTPSKTEYTVLINQATDFFISNKQPVNTKAGQELYIVYTVESVDATTTSKQHGVVASDNNTAAYPYEKGGQLKYGTDNVLLEEGFTYFIKLTRGKDGISYVAVRAKGKESEYFSFPNTFGEATSDFKFLGLWFGDGQVTAKLSHILCYDQNGNDLGIAFLEGRGVAFAEEPMKQNTNVESFYTVTASDAATVALSNARPTGSDTVYMEYTVKSSASKIYQTGVINTATPTAVYPFTGGTGMLRFEVLENPGAGYLLKTGAKYMVRFARNQDNFDATVQRTVGGETETHKFALSAGDYQENAGYFSLWFGEGPDYPVEFELIDFKCYDKNGNDLGLQANAPLEIMAFGEIADYSGCQAVYLNQDTGNTVALYTDRSAKVTENGKTTLANYKIKDGKLYLKSGEKTGVYDYAYRCFTSEDGISYNRLGNYKVTFVTDSGKAPPIQILSPENGYKVKEPEKPVKNSAEFEGWFLSDGSKFSFGEMTVKSVTLYAKWSDKTDYNPVSAQKRTAGKIQFDFTPFLAIGASLLLLAAGAAAGYILYRRAKKV